MPGLALYFALINHSPLFNIHSPLGGLPLREP